MYVDIIYSQYIYICINIRIDESNEVNRGGEKTSPVRWVFYTGVVHGFHELRIPKPLRILPNQDFLESNEVLFHCFWWSVCPSIILWFAFDCYAYNIEYIESPFVVELWHCFHAIV